ncbi:hypothetical protein Tco_0121290 [Tanacetum coccineum]
MLSRKRLCLTALAFKFEVGESSTATVSRQTRHTLARRVDYGFIDTLDTSIQASEGIVMTAVEDVNERVTDLVSTQRREMRSAARGAWSRSEDRSTALEALIRAHEAHIIELEAQIRAFMSTTDIESESALEMQSARMDQLMPVVVASVVSCVSYHVYPAKFYRESQANRHEKNYEGQTKVTKARNSLMVVLSSFLLKASATTLLFPGNNTAPKTTSLKSVAYAMESSAHEPQVCEIGALPTFASTVEKLLLVYRPIQTLTFFWVELGHEVMLF